MFKKLLVVFLICGSFIYSQTAKNSLEAVSLAYDTEINSSFSYSDLISDMSCVGDLMIHFSYAWRYRGWRSAMPLYFYNFFVLYIIFKEAHICQMKNLELCIRNGSNERNKAI